jgi:hypothetical protein
MNLDLTNSETILSDLFLEEVSYFTKKRFFVQTSTNSPLDCGHQE